jgi:tetratricopeptide (TPR) repeat protein
MDPDSLTCTLPAHPRHALMRERRVIERDIIVGNFGDAAEKARELLQRDPYDARMIELFCEANSLMGKPESVYEFAKELQLQKLSATTQIIVAETLASIHQQTEPVEDLARRLLQAAASGRFQETEARKLVVNLRKLGENEQAINVIDRLLASNPTLRNSASLLQLRGKSYIDFAKRCTDTARNRNSSSRIKARAWEECRRYLSEAERDLQHALEHAASLVDREYIQKDMEFLKKLRHIARKPPR